MRQSLDAEQWSDDLVPAVQRLAELAELFGFDVHMQTDYGDEAGGLTPWELFDEEDAQIALEIATEAHTLAVTIADTSQNTADAGVSPTE